MTADHTPHLFEVIVTMSAGLGVSNIGRLPGCWEHTWEHDGGEWYVAVNGHEADTRCERGQPVPPFSAYVEFNGWPAGVIDPAGWVMAEGAVANARTFIAACDAAAPAIRPVWEEGA